MMSFYNTGATIDFRASFYRDETLDFCRTLAGLVSAKIELDGTTSG